MPNGGAWYRNPALWAVVVAAVAVVAGVIYYLYPREPSHPDFSMSVDPLQGTVKQGGVASTSVKVESVDGYAQKVNLDGNGQPSGAVITFMPPLGELKPAYTSTVTISVAANVPVGEYELSMRGVGADGKEHTVKYMLSVQPSSTSTPTPPVTPSLPGGASAVITSPSNNAQVGKSVEVEGTSKNIGNGSYLWLVVYDSNVGRYYPQHGPVTPQNGQWSATAYFGSNGKYFVIVLSADNAANNALLQYQTKSEASSDFPGVTTLFDGATELQRITVQKA